MVAKFILSRKKLLEQVGILKDLGLKISYSYKTNREVGEILQEVLDIDFSIHAKEELDMISDKSRIWFFTQAESEKELEELFEKGIRNFVVDNKLDLEVLLKTAGKTKIKVNVSLRMKIKEHRISSGKYFVYGMSSREVNNLIPIVSQNSFVSGLGIHIHRKSQNVSEWDIKSDIVDSLSDENLGFVKFFNFGGGLPVKYRSYSLKVLDYIFSRIVEAKEFLEDYGIDTHVEPGRFLAAPCIKLETEIIQIQGNNIILNTTIYNCALDTILTGTKMLVEGELDDSESGDYYLIKGNSPTRDDIFRYKVKLKNPKAGDKIVFLNAGAYNYTTDFFGYNKLKTEVVE
ncbi:MAG: decarboxylase [Nanoarchaeota archaeon]|nr:decarboxylase [Nanoarchaeota archaeon]